MKWARMARCRKRWRGPHHPLHHAGVIGMMMGLGSILGCPPSAPTPTPQGPIRGTALLQSTTPTDTHETTTNGPVAADWSWRPLDYMAQGMAAPTEPWTANEWQTALRVLKSLDDPRKLPRWESRQSGQIFSHLISPHHLAVVDNELIALPTRFGSLHDFLAIANELHALYKTASTNDSIGVFDVEIVETAHLLVWLLQRYFVIAERVHATLPRHDPPQFAARSDRLNRSCEQWADALRQAVSLLDTNTDGGPHAFRLRPPVVVRLANHLESTMPAMWPTLAPSLRNELRETLAAMAARENVAAVKSAIEAIIAALPSAAVITPTRIVHRSNAGDPSADGWFTAASSSGRFTVRVPAVFDDFTLLVRAHAADTPEVVPNVAHHTIEAAATADGMRFVAVCIDGLPDRAANFVPASAAEFLPPTEFLLQSESPITLPSHPDSPGHEWRVAHIDAGTLRIVRLFRIGHLGYRLLVDYPAPTDATSIPPAAVRFFESFTPDPR